MKMSLILIAAIAFGATAPVLAAQSDDEIRVRVTYDTKRDKYCISQSVTGSRLPVRDCRSKQEWAAEGVMLQDRRGEKLAAK